MCTAFQRWMAMLVVLIAGSGVHADLSAVPSGEYGLDRTHGYITISYSHLGFSHPEVGFNTFDVVLTFDSARPENSSLEVSVDVASVDSRVDELDAQLRGEDFFDAAKHPTITFSSTGIEMIDAGSARVTGNLTIKGITRPVVLQATLNKAANHPMLKVPTLGISASTTINRSEFDMGRYVPAVSDEVEVRIEVELPRSTET